ncbi:MAG: flagellar protein FlaG [Burkholderiales bacterium]|nr:flagellar protein FlaG [Burkholderiales bacterium]
MTIRSTGGTTDAGAPRPSRGAPRAESLAAGDAGSAAGKAPAAVAAEAVRRAVETVNRALQRTTPMLEFRIDDQTGQTVVRVVDAATQQVLRQIPSEEMLAIARAIDRLQGVLVRQKA